MITRIMVFVVALSFIGLLCFVLRVPASTKEQERNRFLLLSATVLSVLWAGMFLCFSSPLQGLQEGEGYVVVYSRMTGPSEWVALVRSDDVNLRTGEYDYIVVRRMDSPLPKNFHEHNGKPQEFIKGNPYLQYITIQ
ncbi:MAG TPA: hypothetical protein VMV38_00035 [Candidatus Paceibacterota bacterium]|nr:hypothetical protein [Candidatus Paceibacterota bacterium]